MAVVAAFFPAAHARADTLLHALGDASNKEYTEMRKLGPAPTPAQINEIRHEVYSPFIARAISEGSQILKAERHKVDNALTELRNALFPQIYKKGAGGTASAGGSSKGGSSQGAGGSSNNAIPSATQNRPSAASQGGSDGAKDVKYEGKKPKEKPVNVDQDGIIQDR